jgi:hypothetical protein
MRHRFSVGLKAGEPGGRKASKSQQDVKAELGRMHRKEKKLRVESLKRFDMHPT